MKKSILLLGFCLYSFSLLLAQCYSGNSLRVLDPRSTWRTATPEIKDVTIAVRPRGLYLEYGVYLTYSAQTTSLNTNRDTLEVQQCFTLPVGAIVNDSWLWVDGFIMKAQLWDRFTATSVYEGFVRRRQDPSILYKNNQTNYEFRIFPMVGNQTRRVRLNFLVPAKWSPKELTAALPLNLFNLSSRMPPVNLIVYETPDWQTPSVEGANSGWTTISDTTFGLSKRTTLTALNSSSTATVAFKAPNPKPYYFAHSPIVGTSDEGYYQFAFMPKQILNEEASMPKKLLFLLDYEANNTSLSANQILDILKTQFRANLTSRDSFTIFYNRLTAKKVSSNWMVADSANIERSFATLSDPSVGIGSSSTLSNLLAEAYGFIKSKQGKGEVMLLSSNVGYANVVAVQSLITELDRDFAPLPVTHVFDFASQSRKPYLSYQSRYYYGNDLLYSVLTSNSRGNHVSLPIIYTAPTLADIEKGVSDIFAQLTPYAPIDVTVRPNVGLTYERFEILGNNLAAVNQAYGQVGRYKGSFPITVDITTTNAQNQLVSGRITIPSATVLTDTATKQIHGGYKLRALEMTTPSSNTLVNRIIQESKAYRVLSLHTAFIALEPSIQKPCDTCRDETGGGTRLAIAELANGKVKIKIYPNPFKERLTIEIEKPAEAKLSNLLIINTLGQVVKTFTVAGKDENAEKLTLTWDAGDATAGAYIFSLTVDGKRLNERLMKIQ